MKSLLFTFVLCLVSAKVASGSLDFTNFNPNNNIHVQALYNLQDALEGYPPTGDEPNPAVLESLFDPNNPDHVDAAETFRSILNGGFYSPLLEAVKANPALAAELNKPANPARTTSFVSFVKGYVSSLGATVRSWFSLRNIVKTILTFVWSAAAFVFPPLVVATPVFTMALGMM